MELKNLSAQQLRRAADLQEHIESLQREFAALLGGTAPSPPSRPPTGNRARISAAGREAIAAAARARWAKYRRDHAAAGRGAKHPKRKLSAAARARIAEIARARWAKVKAAGKNKL